VGAKCVDVAIVGGGMAGVAAADVLARHGVKVMILDDTPRPGGQYLRGRREGTRALADVVKRRGLRLIDCLVKTTVEVRSRCEILGIESGPELLAADGSGELFTVRAEHLLVATGARERFMPFKGWTLPGVLSTGAAQVLIKQSGILPARRTLVAGAGIFRTAVACDIRKNGGRVPAVFDEMPFSRRIPDAFLMAGHFPKFLRGGATLARLYLAGTAVRSATRVLEARGADRVGEVVTARLDPDGRAITGSETAWPTECLAVGFGFTSNIELAQLAGCGLGYNSSLGGWVVKVNEDLETTMGGIYAAGEVTAIGGAAKSLIEGRLAGFSILRRMGRRRSEEKIRDAALLKKARKRQLAFARYFNAQYTLPPERLKGIIHGLDDDVLICRCENVNIGTLRRAVAQGFDTPAGVKKATRCGMGICQGSTCKTMLLDVLATLTGKQLSHLPLPSVRVPVKPVYLGKLVGENP
jgi:D-hydroxyproline dehydrogenase subunit alpha